MTLETFVNALAVIPMSMFIIWVAGKLAGE
jgi:hypothetical protein